MRSIGSLLERNREIRGAEREPCCIEARPGSAMAVVDDPVTVGGLRR